MEEIYRESLHINGTKTFLNISSSDDDYRVTRDGTLILGVEVKTPKLRNNNIFRSSTFLCAAFK